MAKSKEQKLLAQLERKLDTILLNLEKSHFREFVEYVHDRKRMLRNSFIFGIVRGLGAAIGFTILGALLWYILQAVGRSSIPLIGDFIAEIVRIVESQV